MNLEFVVVAEHNRLCLSTHGTQEGGSILVSLSKKMGAAQHRAVCTSSDSCSLVSAALLGAQDCRSTDHCFSSQSRIGKCWELREDGSGLCVYHLVSGGSLTGFQ